ncbi:hypothetical protein Swit_5069 (plasmid) [Rhizorhabdus wittichii RW1]|uniref:HTH-like domain-containing protein n=1 Tax=Rhizorhabdus wittichii (strain DSM 6014 / CCUG 31198 / JCM 15750 / NBRC 105917 / EY 4224 / RW1) TaxID=392499 RepID=A0A9J9HHL1_RHIWR|nr:hypothetical protein Swit_5069 [Rhizorhabdus wittichii RW1]
MLGQHRSTHRKVPRGAEDEQRLTDDIIALAKQYGRYGYRRVTALLRDAGWTVNRKRVATLSSSATARSLSGMVVGSPFFVRSPDSRISRPARSSSCQWRPLISSRL